MDIVEKIHKEFDLAQEVILKEAKEMIESNQIDKPDRIQLMKDLGFTGTDVVKEATKKLDIQVKNRETAERVMYYKNTYPFLKFLTESKLDEICEKYNLIYAPVQNYKKNVPDKNLHEIANAQELKLQDAKINKFKYAHIDSAYSTRDPKVMEFLENHIFDRDPERAGEQWLINLYEKTTGNKFDGRWHITWMGSRVMKIDTSGLFIAAPKSHFNLEDLEQTKKLGFFRVTKLEPKDPIVFRYVLGGIQVLSKWGDEAEDPRLVNGIMN